MPPDEQTDHDLLIRIDSRTANIENTMRLLTNEVKNNRKEFEDCRTHRGREIGKLYTEITVLKESPKSSRKTIIIGCTILSVVIAVATLIVIVANGGSP